MPPLTTSTAAAELPCANTPNAREDAALVELRKLVASDGLKCDDAQLRRFLRARDLDVTKARAMALKWQVGAHVRWRAHRGACESHGVHFNGWSRTPQKSKTGPKGRDPRPKRTQTETTDCHRTSAPPSAGVSCQPKTLCVGRYFSNCTCKANTPPPKKMQRTQRGAPTAPFPTANTGSGLGEGDDSQGGPVQS